MKMDSHLCAMSRRKNMKSLELSISCCHIGWVELIAVDQLTGSVSNRTPSSACCNRIEAVPAFREER